MGAKGKEDRAHVVCTFSWIHGLWIQYLSEKYNKTWNEIVCGLLREYAAKDVVNLHTDDLKRFVLGSDLYKALTGEKLLGLLKDIEALDVRRKGETQSTPATQPYAGRKRRRQWPVGQLRVTVGWFEHAILDYYANRSGYNLGTVMRLLLRGFMVADQKLKTDEVGNFLSEAKKEIPKQHWDDIDTSWEHILRERERCRQIRRVKKLEKQQVASSSEETGVTT